MGNLAIDVLDPGDLIDSLSGVGIDVEELAHVVAVADLHLPDEVVAPGRPATSPSRKTVRCRVVAESSHVSFCFATIASAASSATWCHGRLRGMDSNVVHQATVCRDQFTRWIKVQAELAAKDRDALVQLFECKVVAAEAVADAPGLTRSRVGWLTPKAAP